MSDIHPELKQKIDKLFEVAKKPYNYNLRITSGYRTPEQQQALYEQGRTRPGKIVTNARGIPVCESDHCKGLAVDIVDTKNGYNINWELLAQMARDIGLKWGGDWKQFPDKPHFYIDKPTNQLTLGQHMFEQALNYNKAITRFFAGLPDGKAPSVLRVSAKSKDGGKRCLLRKFDDGSVKVRIDVSIGEFVESGAGEPVPMKLEDIEKLPKF